MASYYFGSKFSWEHYLKSISYMRDIKGEVRRASRAERLSISRQTQEIVASKEAIVRKFGEGFDAVNGTLDRGFSRVEKAVHETKESLEELRASFDYNMALLLEQLRLQNEFTIEVLDKLDSIHNTLENPLLTQARELFRIGSERLIKGLLDKALEAFIASAHKDDTNFMTQLMIGKLYLYGANAECNVIDLRKAEEHLLAAARYARAESKSVPEAKKFAAEALLHAAIAKYVQASNQLVSGNDENSHLLLQSAYTLAQEANEIDPELSEGHYHQAKFAALIGEREVAVRSLETAIEQNDEYCLKVDGDADFGEMRPEVENLFIKLRGRSEFKLQQKLAKCEAFLTDWRYPTLEAQNAKKDIQMIIDEARNCFKRNTYFDNRDALNLLLQAEINFQNLLVHRASMSTLSAHTGRITTIAFSPEQSILASGGADCTLRIWKLPENQLLYTLEGHSDPITELVFSHDGRALASVDRKGNIKVWSIATGMLIYDLRASEGPVHSIAFSPNDEYLAAGCYDRNTKIWNMDDGSLQHVLTGHKSSVDTLVFSYDGALLATGSPDNTALLWDTQSGKLWHTFLGCSGLANSLAFAADNRTLICGSNDGSVRMYDVQNGQLVHTLPERGGTVSWLTLSPDCTYLATIYYQKGMKLWEVETGKLLQTYTPFSAGITSVRFSPDGTLLAATDFQDQSVKIWNTNNNKLAHVIAGSITCNAFSADGRLLVTGDEMGSLKLWGRMIVKRDEEARTRQRSRPSRRWEPRFVPSTRAIKPGKTASPGTPRPKAKAALPPSRPEAPQRRRPASPPKPAPEKQTASRPIEQQTARPPEPPIETPPAPTPQAEQNPERLMAERMKDGRCYVCGRKIGFLAKMAGIKLCHKHYFHF